MEEVAAEPLLPAETSEDFDPETMRTEKPGLKRLVLIVTVFLSFILGLHFVAFCIPFLWKTVEIYRSLLPFADVETLSEEVKSDPLRFPCRFQAVFFRSGSGSGTDLDQDRLRSSLLEEITNLAPDTPRCGSCFGNFTLSVVVDDGACRRSGPSSSYECGAIGAVDFESGDEGMIDEALESAVGDGKTYSVVAVVGGGRVRAVVGKYRHAWVMAREDVELKGMVAEIFTKVFVGGGVVEGSINPEFIPVGADGRIVLSFNLLNADPYDWVYDWDFRSVDETLLAPVIEALAPIANISVESQVLYHTPKSSFSFWNEKLQSHVFSTKDLPFFVNSNEWHLDTSIAAGGRSKILQFVVYIPSARECPLRLQLPSGKMSSTNGFISPMWGGVMVWNPYGCSKISGSKLLSRNVLSSEDLEKVLGVFMGQLRQLVGLKSSRSYIGVSGTFSLLASERGFTEWELDFLSRQHTCFNLHSSATTLGSLSRLVQSLPRMIITDEIGKQVKVSLEAARQAQINASYGVYDASAVSSRQARSLAEDAFFHPSIMSVSYYSFEHCFAVYSPFFLPVLVHVIQAAIKEWKRYRKEKTKYLLWKSRTKARNLTVQRADL